jgi:hypothetical protein
MGRVSRHGKGKTLYITLSVYPCGNANPQKNLTISCSQKDTEFKSTLSDNGMKKFRKKVLEVYKKQILQRE